MRTYKFTDGRPFRLSGMFIDDNGTYQTTIFWLDSKLFQTFFWVEIDPLMEWNIKTVEEMKAEIKAEKIQTIKKPIIKKKPNPPTAQLF